MVTQLQLNFQFVPKGKEKRDADCRKDKVKQTIKTNKQKYQKLKPNTRIDTQIAWEIRFQRRDRIFFLKKGGEILKLYLVDFHTTKTLPIGPNFWIVRMRKTPSTFDPKHITLPNLHTKHQGKNLMKMQQHLVPNSISPT